MNKERSVAFLIILSILMLSLKDSATLIHTILHYLPNNPWHQHEDIHTHHHINPLEIHKYLAHKHHAHNHAHDLMDHIHPHETKKAHSSPSEKLPPPIKIDYYYQSIVPFHVQQYSSFHPSIHFSLYLASTLNRGTSPLYQPPQIQVNISVFQIA